jgi:catalase-peroxidase
LTAQNAVIHQAVNQPEELAKVIAKLESIQKDFNKSLSDGKKVSLADVIVVVVMLR